MLLLALLLGGAAAEETPPPAPPPPPPLPSGPTNATVSIDLGLQSQPMNPLIMGCHSDSGFAHEPRALYSQMIMGESWEAKDIDGDAPLDPETGGSVGGTWPNPSVAPGAVGSGRVVASRREAFHGLQAQQLTLASGGHVGVANRGLGNEGMVFEAGREYEGYVWAKADGAAPLTLEVALEDHTQGGETRAAVVLSSQTLQVPAGAGRGPAAWTQVHFTLRPNSSTNCEGIENAEAWSRYRVSCPINNTCEPTARARAWLAQLPCAFSQSAVVSRRLTVLLTAHCLQTTAKPRCKVPSLTTRRMCVFAAPANFVSA